ncbi:MAG: rRNA pseudouridine synthase [Lentisphaeraceae bacterium]|nr:rRNA pseudouridine synthase [Lentisphaeraceae bacterium]
MRLARFLAMAGVASRRASEELITAGKVIVNGNKCTNVATNVDPDTDTVTYKGRRLHIKKNIYLALNKPTGYACTASDPHEKKTIFNLLPKTDRLFSVGRLDKNSEGLILVTNDGEFANKLMHPRYELEKRYRVYVTGEIVNHAINDVSRNGITHEDIFYKTKNIEIRKRTDNGGVLHFTLTEGKKREIRKICKALGLTVRSLKRTQVGDLKLGELPVGSYRELREKEIEALIKLTKSK